MEKIGAREANTRSTPLMFAGSIKVAARPTDQWDNQRSTADTIAQMGHVADISCNTPLVLSSVDQSLASLSDGYTHREVCEAIWYWIHSHIRFVTDEETMEAMGIPISNPTKELLISPPALLSMAQPQGDCDDFSMLCRSMLKACGIRMSFITIKADKSDPNKWSHVYGKAYYPGGTMYMDTSHGEWPNWEYKGYWEKREWA